MAMLLLLIYLTSITYFVNQNRSVYPADMSNGRIVKLDEGVTQMSVVIGGFQSFGVARLSLPHFVIVDHLGTVYVAEYRNNRVTRWLPGAKSGIVIAGSSSQGQGRIYSGRGGGERPSL